MSESASSPVFLFDSNDPEMQQASANARNTFRYFWRELSWERRRIIPALGIASVKAPFADDLDDVQQDGQPKVEQMWLSEIDFDGNSISGVLLNSPNWLKSVKQGDSVQVPLRQISDWMYTIGDEVFGAYTVNLMRSRMGQQERRQHDSAWGLKFGDPSNIRIRPEPKSKVGFWKRLFGKPEPKPQPQSDEHPMSEGMAAMLKAQLEKDPSLVSIKSDKGWTFLHQESLAGNVATVKVLLEAGADPNTLTAHGMTARQLAETLQWDKVLSLLPK